MILLRLLALASPQRPRAAAAVALQVLTVACGIGLMGTSAWLLSRAAQHPSIAALQVAIVGVRAFGIGRAVLRYLERLVAHDVTLRLLARLRLGLFRALAPLAPAALQDRRAGDVLSRAVEDVATLEGAYVRVAGPSLSALGVTLLLALLLSPFGAGITAVALCGLAAAGVLAPAAAARLASEPGRRLVELRGLAAARLSELVLGAGDVLAFGREAVEAERAHALTRRALEAQRQQVSTAALGSALAGLAADLTVVAVLALAVHGLRSGPVDGVLLAPVALLTLAAFEGVAALPAAWQGLGAQREAARRVFELADARPPVGDPTAVVPPRSNEPGAPAPLLELRDVRFKYPGASRPALDGVTLRLEAGRRVALVGPSGSGKSTLVQLLLRFWDVDPGTVRLLGVDVRALHSDAVRERIAWAGQSAHVFTGTLRDNLLVGRPAATSDELRSVIEAVRLDGLLRQLPHGLDEWVGEQGHRLSGGERQRLALARCLLRTAPLLLLDEPTAHLDALTERELLGALWRAGEGRATLLVTHRLVGLEAFDEVIVLEQGRVVERGRASALAVARGYFARALAQQRDLLALDDGAFPAAAAPLPSQ